MNLSKSDAKMRTMPNPHSELLVGAIVGGAGLTLPPEQEVPEGMAAVVLFVPMEKMLGKSPMDIQDDLGLPWHMEGGNPVWFDEL